MNRAPATRLLLVEDNPGDARLLREMFRDAGPGTELTHVSGMREAEALLAEQAVDLILLDLGLPDAQGLEAVRRAQAAAPRVPLVVLTGSDDESLAVQTLQQGAQDYLIKGEIETRGLQRALRHAVERKVMALKTRAVDEELERSNRELQDFATIASHDLQEPLRKIQAFGDRLAEHASGALDEEAEGYLERMKEAAGRMQSLIEGLLDYSRLTVQPEPTRQVDLGTVVSEVLSDLDWSIRASRGRVIVGPLPTLLASPVQMRLLFANLIANALKFHAEGVAPEVHVEVTGRDEFRGAKGRRQRPPVWEISVSDNGIGFDPQDAEKIFEPFKRLNGRQAYEGTGIGLAICRRIVGLRGGTITARSHPGAGATFVLTLPRTQPPAGAVAPADWNPGS